MEHRNQWPEPDDKVVVYELLADRYSPHWEQLQCYFATLALRLRVPADEVDDLTQECMMAVVKHLAQFRYECSLKTWLMSIARTKAIDHHRRKLRTQRSAITVPVPSEEDEEVNVPMTAMSPEEEYIQREALEEALRHVLSYCERRPGRTERYRMILILVLFENRSTEEVARMLGVSAPVVSYTLRCTRNYLREKEWQAREKERRTLEE